MRCPVDNEALVMADRNGVEIDYCPKCRGVWLDRGELDKIIDCALPAESARTAPPPSVTPSRSHDSRPRHDDEDDYRHGYRKKRRESFLGELFDF